MKLTAHQMINQYGKRLLKPERRHPCSHQHLLTCLERQRHVHVPDHEGPKIAAICHYPFLASNPSLLVPLWLTKVAIRIRVTIPLIYHHQCLNPAGLVLVVFQVTPACPHALLVTEFVKHQNLLLQIQDCTPMNWQMLHLLKGLRCTSIDFLQRYQ